MDINYEIGHQYAINGEYNSAYFYLQKSLKKGNAAAANDIGVMFEHINKYVDAFQAYKDAIKLGNIVAYFNLGNLYEYGLGTIQDYKKAKECYLKSVEHKYSPAYKKMSKFYIYGLGVRKNYNKSFEYLTQGAELEKEEGYCFTDCTSALAFSYNKGYGVEKDEKKAFELWDICAKNGNVYSAFHAALCMLDGVVTDKNPEAAIELLIHLAVEEKYSDAMLTLTRLFERGDYVDRDYEEAGRWLIEAASKGNADAFLKIANIYLAGNERPYNFNKNYCNKAIVDFLASTLGKEKEYAEEYKIYNKLKATYPDKVDWEYLETMPDLSKNKEEQLETSLC